MRIAVLSLIPVLALALTPTFVSERPAVAEAGQFCSPGGLFRANVTYAAGNSEFVPFERFELLDPQGKTVYVKNNTTHTVLDIADNGLVVGVDFDGPVSGHAKLHFYDTQGKEHGTADVGFWNRHGFCADGSVYCVLDGKQGLRVFSARGKELYNADKGNRFAVSPDGHVVALATDEAIRFLRDGVPTVTVSLATPFVRAMAFSPDGERFGYCERGALYVHRTSDGALQFQFRPADAKHEFISLDIGNQLTAAGLDLDGGRGTPDRHRRGLVILLDGFGAPVWQQELTYKQWNIASPEVRFGAAGAFRVKTADAVLEYRYEEE